jgi:adenylate cyclase
VLDRAAIFAEKAIALDDEEAMAYALLAMIAAHKGNWDQAHAYGSRAYSLDPNNAFICVALASVWGLGFHPKEAMAYAEKGMRLDPRHPEFYWEEQGFAYNDMKRYPEALDALKKADQNDPHVHLALIWTYHGLGRPQDGRDEAAAVMCLSPEFSLAGYKQSEPFDWSNPGYQQLLSVLRNAGLK